MSKDSGTENIGKQSFNVEPDVAPLLAAWQEANPHVIKSRMFNDALRLKLARYGRKRRVREGAAA
jgi:hypothetical protein